LNIGGLKPEEFYKEVKASFFQCLPLDESSIITSYQLPMYHKDPFDRALVWEAIQKSLVLLSTDSFSDSYINDGLMVIH
jgi:PIN domain nuclease of toxin-antitoxin system